MRLGTVLLLGCLLLAPLAADNKKSAEPVFDVVYTISRNLSRNASDARNPAAYGTQTLVSVRGYVSFKGAAIARDFQVKALLFDAAGKVVGQTSSASFRTLSGDKKLLDFGYYTPPAQDGLEFNDVRLVATWKNSKGKSESIEWPVPYVDRLPPVNY